MWVDSMKQINCKAVETRRQSFQERRQIRLRFEKEQVEKECVCEREREFERVIERLCVLGNECVWCV